MCKFAEDSKEFKEAVSEVIESMIAGKNHIDRLALPVLTDEQTEDIYCVFFKSLTPYDLETITASTVEGCGIEGINENLKCYFNGKLEIELECQVNQFLKMAS